MKNRLLPVLILFIFATAVCRAQTPVLWGATTVGGAYGVGTIFISTPTGDETMYNFGANTPDGFNPYGSLIHVNDSLLYGTTYSGGANDDGTIFSYNISTGVERDVHDFGADTDGQSPYGSLTQVGDSLLYGLTFTGGSYDGGIIFSYNIFTGVETNLHSFGSGADGANPNGYLLWAKDSLLYGLTEFGGYDNSGVLFSYAISTATETALYDFGSTDSTDGQNPSGSLIQAANGLLYGMTPYGGDSSSGIIFSYNIAMQTETNVYDFGLTYTDGVNPFGSLLQATDTLLYGMTYDGGYYNNGTIFSYNTVTSKEAAIHDFDSYAYDGAFPEGSLIQASDGLLYGLTNLGGVNDSGTVMSYDISTGAERVLHSFAGLDGMYPTGDLIEVDSPTAGVKQLIVDRGQLTVYPNPSSDFIYVDLTMQQTQPVVLSLYNILGQEVWSILTPSNTNSHPTATIPVAGLAEGVYVLKASVGNISQQKEIVVAR